MDKSDFKKRFVARMIGIMGQYEPYFEFAATSAYDNYLDDPEDNTPEGHADVEVEEWRDNL
jgi:hypothetical protein